MVENSKNDLSGLLKGVSIFIEIVGIEGAKPGIRVCLAKLNALVGFGASMFRGANSSPLL